MQCYEAVADDAEFSKLFKCSQASIVVAQVSQVEP